MSRTVSEVVAAYSPDFPKEAVAAKVAARDGREPEDVIAEWDLKGDVAVNFGHAIDKAVRLWIRFGVLPSQPFLAQAVEEFKPFLDGLTAHADVRFENELLRGITDIVISHGEKEVSIWDIKTNGDLDTAHGKMLPPFNLPASNLNKYRLQLSLYGYLAEDMGLKVREYKIPHYSNKWTLINVEPLSGVNWQEIVQKGLPS